MSFAAGGLFSSLLSGGVQFALGDIAPFAPSCQAVCAESAIPFPSIPCEDCSAYGEASFCLGNTGNLCCPTIFSCHSCLKFVVYLSSSNVKYSFTIFLNCQPTDFCFFPLYYTLLLPRQCFT